MKLSDSLGIYDQNALQWTSKAGVLRDKWAILPFVGVTPDDPTMAILNRWHPPWAGGRRPVQPGPSYPVSFRRQPHVTGALLGFQDGCRRCEGLQTLDNKCHPLQLWTGRLAIFRRVKVRGSTATCVWTCHFLDVWKHGATSRNLYQNRTAYLKQLHKVFHFMHCLTYQR